MINNIYITFYMFKSSKFTFLSDFILTKLWQLQASLQRGDSPNTIATLIFIQNKDSSEMLIYKQLQISLKIQTKIKKQIHNI